MSQSPVRPISAATTRPHSRRNASMTADSAFISTSHRPSATSCPQFTPAELSHRFDETRGLIWTRLGKISAHDGRPKGAIPDPARRFTDMKALILDLVAPRIYCLSRPDTTTNRGHTVAQEADDPGGQVVGLPCHV